MGIFSLPAELARCSDLLLWFAPPPWSPLRLTPCSWELATLVLVLATLAPPSLPLPSPLPPLLPPLPTLPPIAVGKSAPCVNAANIPVPCNAGAVLAAPAIATTGLIGGYSTLGGHYYGKREAEADAEPLLLGAGYAGLAGAAIAAPAIATTAYAAAPAIATTAYAAPIAVAKSAPCVNAANVPVPCNAGAVLAAPAIAAPAIATTGLIGGYSILGGHYYGKREAEAEPYLGYAGLAGYGKSAPCVNAANFPVPCRGFY